MTRRSKSPCLGCAPPERSIGCHGRCKRYAEYAAQKERDRDARVKFLTEMQISEGLRRTIRKAEKKKLHKR